jgi:hypothetical protein
MWSCQRGLKAVAWILLLYVQDSCTQTFLGTQMSSGTSTYCSCQLHCFSCGRHPRYGCLVVVFVFVVVVVVVVDDDDDDDDDNDW